MLKNIILLLGLVVAVWFIATQGALLRPQQRSPETVNSLQENISDSAYVCWTGDCATEYGTGKTFRNEDKIKVAHTAEQREMGLSGTSSLDPYVGMLFVFPEEGQYSFWMKDMNYPIDIVWISAQKKIVHIESAVQPKDFPKTYVSQDKALYVLELPQGNAQQKGLLIGASIDFYFIK